MRRTLSLSIAVALVSLLAISAPQARAVTTKAALNMTLPELKFSNVALGDCFDFLRDVSGVNIHVNWRAIEVVGVSKDTTVNVRLRAITLKKALQLLLSESGAGDQLAFYTDQGVIEVTTKEIADKQLYTKVYPIDDLLVEIPDFTDAPQFDLSQQQTQTGNQSTRGGQGGLGGSGGGSGSGGQGLFGGQGGGQNGNTEQIRTKAERAQQIVQLIMDTIQPEIWKENGGTAVIRYWNGSLIVTAPRSIHEMIGGSFD